MPNANTTDSKTVHYSPEELHEAIKKDREEAIKRAREVEKKLDEQLDEQYLHHNLEDEYINYKGIFVEILRQYEGKRIKLKVSSFTHKNIECYVKKSTARHVILQKVIDGKLLFLAQTSVKDVEEV